MKLEVVVVPVSDVDRAKDFYHALGWRLDADFVADPDFRVMQTTLPGSDCAIIFGTGITSAAPRFAAWPHHPPAGPRDIRAGGVRLPDRPGRGAAPAVHIMTNTPLTGATYDIDGGQQLIPTSSG
jgi:catechol 2,3-dioxygenase-like lactoylglutathione lyase family enzyme